MTKLYIRFFEHKEGIPTDSHKIADGPQEHAPWINNALFSWLENIEDWMRKHPDGKVDFVWL